MRLKRLLAGTVAGFVTLVMPTAFLAPADAAPAQGATFEARTAQGSAHGTAQDGKAKRWQVSIRFVGGDGSFGLVGKVEPKAKGKNKEAVLQRSDKKAGNYKRFRTDKTNGKARYGFTKLKTPGWYQVTVFKGRGFKAGTSKKIHVTKG